MYRARWGEPEHHARDREFVDRLEIAKARIAELEHALVNMGEGNERRIRLPEFASWALAMQWPIPPAFAEMAEAAIKGGKPRNESLGTTERGTVQKLIAGFLAQAYSRERIAKPYAIAKDVQAALQSVGLHLSDDTIVNWIKDAASLLTAPDKKAS